MQSSDCLIASGLALMPLRELRHPQQVEAWLADWGRQLTLPAELVLIGSGALLWHAAQRGIDDPLTECSMDVDPVTESEEVARLAYQALIGSEFERTHGWHVNLMPKLVLQEFPAGWRDRAHQKCYGHLTVVVPGVPDLLVPKLKRGEPRDMIHARWAATHKLT